MKKTPKKIKILLIGDSFVGKSTLVNMIRGKDYSSYSPTIFDNIYHYLEIDDKVFQLDIRDTSGAPEYSNLITTHLRDIDLAIMCYAVDNRVSFYNINAFWYEKVRHIPVLLVGLKIDLRYNQFKDSEIKIINYQEGKELSEKLGCEYMEFCKTDDKKQQLENIERLFANTIEMLDKFSNKNKNNNKNVSQKNKCNLL